MSKNDSLVGGHATTGHQPPPPGGLIPPPGNVRLGEGFADDEDDSSASAFRTPSGRIGQRRLKRRKRP